MNNFAQHNVNV